GRDLDKLQIFDIAGTTGLLCFIRERNRKIFRLLCMNGCAVFMDTCDCQDITPCIPHDTNMNLEALQLFQLTLDAGHVLAEWIEQTCHVHHFLYKEMTSCQV